VRTAKGLTELRADRFPLVRRRLDLERFVAARFEVKLGGDWR
jgi:hypothetical protein